MSALTRALAGLACATLIPAAAVAGEDTRWPDKPIQLLIPYPPGGSADLVARPLSQVLTQALGQPVVLEYKPGAGGALASQAAARAAPDGHTFLMVLAAHAINPSLYPTLPYDTRKDFAAVSLVANLPLLLSVRAGLPVKTVDELIAMAKADPGKLTFGSAGNGNTSHLAAELFSKEAGIKMTHVPYRGSAPMLNAMLGGEIDLMFDSASTSLPHATGERMRPVAVTGDQRLPMLKDTPTVAEGTMKDFVVNGWYAILAPAGTPQPVIDRMSQAIAKAVEQPAMKAQLEEKGYAVVGSTPAELQAHIDRELERWAVVVKDSGARVD